MHMKTQRGLTLVELLVTLAVAAIVISVALPNFRSMVQSNRASAHTNDFVLAVSYARSEALRRGGDVRLCSSTDQASCTGNEDWAVGWVVRDEDDNEVLRVWPVRTGDATMVEAGGTTQVDFAGDGTAEDTLDITLDIYTCAYHREIALSRMGRTDINRPGCP